MKWFVEVNSIVGDEHVLTHILDAQGYKLLVRSDDGGAVRNVLYHQKFEELNDASAIRIDVQRVGERLERFSRVGDVSIGFSVGPIQQVREDGTVTKNIAISGRTVISIQGHATLTRVPSPSLPEEERLAQEKELAARAQTEQRERAIRLATAALKDERVLSVMEMMGIQDPSPTQLGHIVELVQDAVGGKMAAFCSDVQLKRFDRSINHPDAMGLAARHAVSNKEPPSRPMSLPEAREFARRIGAAWLSTLGVMKPIAVT